MKQILTISVLLAVLAFLCESFEIGDRLRSDSEALTEEVRNVYQHLNRREAKPIIRRGDEFAMRRLLVERGSEFWKNVIRKLKDIFEAFFDSGMFVLPTNTTTNTSEPVFNDTLTRRGAQFKEKELLGKRSIFKDIFDAVVEKGVIVMPKTAAPNLSLIQHSEKLRVT